MMSIDNDSKNDEGTVEVHASNSTVWAGTVSFLALLVFIGTLVYLAHNHWHF